MAKIIELNLDTWAKTNLPISAFIVLQLLTEDRRGDVEEFCHIMTTTGDVMPEMSNNEFIEVVGEKIVPTLKSKALFKKNDVNDWIDEWRNKFPAGTSDTGNRWRSTHPSCLKKMSMFIKKYGCSKEDIYRATDGYLRKLNGDFKYCKMATNFIYKDTIDDSALLSEIEGLGEKSSVVAMQTNDMV